MNIFKRLKLPFKLQLFASALESNKKFLDLNGVGLFLNKIDQRFSKKATTSTATIPASGWVQSGEGYSYTLTVPGVTANTIVIIHPSSTDPAQIEAWADAWIVGAETGTNTAKITALKDKPEVDITVMLVKGG